MLVSLNTLVSYVVTFITVIHLISYYTAIETLKLKCITSHTSMVADINCDFTFIMN